MNLNPRKKKDFGAFLGEEEQCFSTLSWNGGREMDTVFWVEYELQLDFISESCLFRVIYRTFPNHYWHYRPRRSTPYAYIYHKRE